jgi:hypothetical protein
VHRLRAFALSHPSFCRAFAVIKGPAQAQHKEQLEQCTSFAVALFSSPDGERAELGSGAEDNRRESEQLMNRRLKALGVAISAMLVMAAFAATAAQAVEFTSSNTNDNHKHEHTLLKATQIGEHVFTASGGFASIRCKEAKFHGTAATGTDTIVTVTPTYDNCSDSLGRTVHVDEKACHYEFHAKTHVSADTFSGVANINCTGGEPITVSVTNGSGATVCTITVGAQEGIGPVHFTNLTGTPPTKVRVDSEATNVKNTTAGGFLNCGVTNGAHEGTYFGEADTEGESTTNVPLDLAVVT